MQITTEYLSRLFDKDTELWTSDTTVADKIRNRLGWLDCVDWYSQNAQEIKGLVDDVHNSGQFDNLLLLGMGGSSLAPEVFAKVFDDNNGLALYMLDSTHPEQIMNVDIDLSRTIVIVASKSGGTIETASLFYYFFDKISKIVANPGQHFIAITDEGSQLQQQAGEYQFRHCFINPSDIGGRYSALSFFGLVPAALIGVDIDKLMLPVSQLLQALQSADSAASNNILTVANALGQKSSHELAILNFIMSDKVAPLFDWIEQLVAESTGKLGKGVLPVLHQARVEQTSRVNVAISFNEDAVESDYAWQLDDEYMLGAEFLRWEIITALTAVPMDINPFDEPNVSEAKASSLQFLQEGAQLEVDTIFENDAFVLQAPANDNNSPAGTEGLNAWLNQSTIKYLATLAYVPTSNEADDLLKAIAEKLSATGSPKVFTTGYGPRYLHSTGQLHKGGPINGAFIEFTDAHLPTLPIPGQDYDFAALIEAQAKGDFHVLTTKSCPVLRVVLKKDRITALQAFDAFLSEVL